MLELRNRLKKLSLLLLLSMLVFASGCKKKTDEDYIQKGFEQLAIPDYNAANQCFNAAIDADVDKVEAYRGLGISSMSIGEYEKAIEYFKQALAECKSTPGDVAFDINYYLGVCYHKLGQYEESKARYDAIIALKPKEVDAYIQRGAEYLYLKDVESACTDFDKAISLRKKDYKLYIDVYNLLSQSGYQTVGVEYLEEALAKNDKNMSDYDKGYINYCLGNYSTAKNYLEAARTGKEKSPDVLMLLGRCYEELNDYPFAINLYQRYLEENPDAGVYNQLSAALIKEKRYEEAIEAVVAGLELDCTECRQQLLYNRICAYEYLGDFAKARDLAQQYIVDYPSDESMAREYKFLQTR